MSPNGLRVSAFYQSPYVITNHEEYTTDWTRFSSRDITSFKVTKTLDAGLAFTFPSRDWTLDFSISNREGVTLKFFGIRSGTNLRSEILNFSPDSGPFKLNLSLHIGEGVYLKRSLELESLSRTGILFKR